MSIEERLSRIEEVVAATHRTVVRIENDHGEKLQALADGLAATNERQDRFEAAVKERFGRLEREVGGLKSEVGGLKSEVGGLKQDMREVKMELQVIKQNTTVLGSIAGDHEARIRSLENIGKDPVERQE